MDESEQGDADAAAERRTILADPPLLVPAKLADRLTTELIRLVPFPSKAVVDAAHIAVAAANGMEYLMTWNFKHIANAALRDRIAWVCRSQGVEVPVICTPEELFEASQ